MHQTEAGGDWPQHVEQELQRYAARYRAANSRGMAVVNQVATHADGALDILPSAVRVRAEKITEAALISALGAAARTRNGVLPDISAQANNAVTAAMGAGGGLGGIGTALAELPFTVTMLMRAISGIAAEHGFEPTTDALKADCVAVFTSAGPAVSDDGADLAFLTTRLSVTGASLQTLIAAVAPRLLAALGPKIAAQSVPLLGAAAGASINLVYTQYYQEMAHIRFGMKNFALENALNEAELANRLAQLIAPPMRPAA